MKPIVILGAGPGGLAAGHRLAANNRKTVILERQNGVGGLARTIVHDRFRFDIGPHRWFTRNEELHRWFLDLMGDELIRVNRFTEIFYDGKFLTYPLKFGNVLSRTGLPQTLFWGGGYVRSKIRSMFVKKIPSTMEEAYIAQFGEELFRAFFKDYSEKLWGRSCNEISADWVEERTQGYSVFQAVWNAMFNRHEKKSGLAEVTEYLHPRLGYGRISERMAAEIRENGGEILLQHEAKSIHHENNRITGVTISDRSGQETFLPAEFLISSIPLPILIQNLKPQPPDEIMNAARGLSFRDLITIHLMFKGPVQSKATWIYLQDASVPFARLSIPTNISPDVAPPGYSSVVMEWFCDAGDKIWTSADPDLIHQAIEHLTNRLRLAQKENVHDAFVFRAPKAYPIYTLEYKSRVQRIHDFIQLIDGLKIVGRGGTFHYHTSDLSIEMGWSVAADLLKT